MTTQHERSTPARHHSGRAIRFLLLLLGTTNLASLGIAAEEPADVSSPQAQPSICRLFSNGQVAYRTAVGPWLSQAEGGIPVVLPLQVDTKDSPCRIEIGTEAFIEAMPASKFTLARNEMGSLLLSLGEGAALYALAPNVDFSIKTTPSGFGACAGETSMHSPSGKTSVFDSTLHTGIVRILPEPDPAIEFVNVRGKLSVALDKDETKAVSATQMLRLPITGNPSETQTSSLFAEAPTTHPKAEKPTAHLAPAKPDAPVRTAPAAERLTDFNAPRPVWIADWKIMSRSQNADAVSGNADAENATAEAQSLASCSWWRPWWHRKPDNGSPCQ